MSPGEGRAPVRRRVVAHGRVQGVFFRETVRREAEARGAQGWVQNRPDGAVEAVLEGRAEAVEALVRLCEEGPSGARVQRVEVRDEKPQGCIGFEVR